MNANGSAVVEVMKRASAEHWKKWRAHVLAGTAHTPEALEAFDTANLAAAVWLDERSARLAAPRSEENAEPPRERCGDAECPGHIEDETQCCDACGVDHSDPCGTCARRGFHAPGCPELSTPMVVLAGELYADAIEPLPDREFDWQEPLKGLGIGERLRWLQQNTPRAKR